MTSPAPAAALRPSWAFLLDTAASLTDAGAILDYGCGSGSLVLEGLKRDLDIWGAEVFYGGSHGEREAAQASGIYQKRLFEIRDGRTPFPDGRFSVVFHSQVFEHVPDLDGALREIARILEPNGFMLSAFPSKEVIREGHCGVPLAHRFSRRPKLGYAWLLAARRLGLGTFHGDKTPEQWARDFREWLNSWCYYRSKTDIVDAYRRAGFTFEPYELEYAVHRLRYTHRGWAVPVTRWLPGLTRWGIEKLAGLVVLSRRV